MTSDEAGGGADDRGGRAEGGVAAGYHVEGPLRGQGAAAERILRALPGWFGIESALRDYAAAADGLPTFVACTPDASGDGGALGFLTLRPTSTHATELHVMGVLPEYHRRGIGRALVERAAAHARAEGFSLLHVKTLAPGDPDLGYARTRAFYEALGFVPLEELPQVWGPENPCLLLVRAL